MADPTWKNLPRSCALCRARYSGLRVLACRIVDIIIGMVSIVMSVDKALVSSIVHVLYVNKNGFLKARIFFPVP